ncbi:MAG: hypothetical protein ACTSPQ_20935 [Candidatus Helarchaeota archaeon]
MKCTYTLPDALHKLALKQRGEDRKLVMMHDPEKVDYVRLKVSYDGKFGHGTFFLIINFDGTLEIQYKDTSCGKALINALTNTLINGDETDGVQNKDFDDQFSIALNSSTFIEAALNALDKIKKKKQ